MNDDRLYLPAEWAVQSGVQLTWPHAGTDWAPYLDEITETYLQLADAITRHEALLVVSPEVERVRELLEARLGRARMDGDEPVLLDFRFNGWGEKFGWQHDNAITRHLCEQGLLHGSREDHDDMVLEGGSIESDGRGTVFTTSQCLLAPHRNQPLSREDTDGHIDTTVRVAPHDTLLYIKCSDQADEHYADFCAMERELQALRTDDGRPYRLIALPMVDEIRYDGERLPATYANFLIVNGAVIYPTYDQPHNDQTAAEALHQAFPDHELIGIDSRVIIRQHGSIHCLTMQLPEGVLCR